MRTKTVEVANKNILIQEMRIKDLKELAKQLNVSFDTILKTDLKDKTTVDVVNLFVNELQDKITTIFPQLTDDDVDNAYMSEIEGLIEGFIDVNFIGLKKVFIKATSLM